MLVTNLNKSRGENMKKQTKGFTLIELIIVLAILGIISAIAVPKYSQMTRKANLRKVATDCKIVKDAMDLYYVSVQDYPSQSINGGLTNQQYLTGKNPNGTEADSKYKPDGWAGPYLEFWPLNPFDDKSKEDYENDDTYQLDIRPKGSSDGITYIVLEIPFDPYDLEAMNYIDELLDNSDGLDKGNYRHDNNDKWSYYILGKY